MAPSINLKRSYYLLYALSFLDAEKRIPLRSGLEIGMPVYVCRYFDTRLF
jgi:hypothetical protein